MLERHPDEVKLVHKNFPIAKHKFARKAAAAALSAHRQGKFWEYHARLFKNHQNLNDAVFEILAQELGLDLEKFQRDMKDSAIERLIIRDMRDGQKAGVRGTPTVFINGKRVKNRNLQTIEAMIKAELEKSKGE
ncbi:MAG: thioredoxin domain-containing protein [candidate division Zixibacteria bacterium]|nr:thioredoxin domain-containing protein [candidate division Zixibacteria bacterium]